MENNEVNYNFLLNELHMFYSEIKNYIFLYFDEKYDKEPFEIDFFKDFVVSNNLNNRFILYDKDSQKFLLSIQEGISKYSKMKNTKSLKLINIKDKMENKYFSCFTNDELSEIIKNYNVDFIKYIKSEFLHEYVKKIIDLQGNHHIHYSDDYVECSEDTGFVINDIIIELETRMFAKKFNLLYIPISLGNDYILKKMYLICLEQQKIIFNANIDELLKNISYFNLKKLLEFEEKEFEKKYNLKKNSLSDEENGESSYKSFDQNQELIRTLKNLKGKYLESLKVMSHSSGFVTIKSFIVVLFVISIMIFIICVIYRW